MKKSKFYLNGTTRVLAKALRRQNGTHETTLISVQKVPKEKLAGEFPKAVAADIIRESKEVGLSHEGIRSFFTLGDRLLRELKSDEKDGDVFDSLEQLNMVSKQKRLTRRNYYDKERRRTAYG